MALFIPQILALVSSQSRNVWDISDLRTSKSNTHFLRIESSNTPSGFWNITESSMDEVISGIGIIPTLALAHQRSLLSMEFYWMNGYNANDNRLTKHHRIKYTNTLITISKHLQEIDTEHLFLVPSISTWQIRIRHSKESWHQLTQWTLPTSFET